jgi:diguanylate cyclase (GGDEF)-like protein/PAS domain S-box-containing protein
MPSDKPLRILMLEDNPADADLNAEQLADAGLSFEYHRVENEGDYLRELAEFKPDVILADYHLPQFDGLSALRLARERYHFIPFILVSGVFEEDAAVELFKAGVTDHVRKGRIARLGVAVKNALALRDAQEEKARAEEELRTSYRDLERRVEERTRQLAQANEALQTIIDSIPVMLTIYDPQLRQFRVNRNFVQVTGWTQEDAQQDLSSKVYPDPDKRAEVLRFMASLAAGWRDFTMTAKDGSRIESSWANIELPDGRRVGIGLDIRERKRAEEELQTREAQLNAFFENAPGILTLADERSCYINTDRITPTYFGMSRETIRGKCAAELSPDFARDFGSLVQRVLDTGEPYLNAEVQSAVPGRKGQTTYWRTSYFRVPLGGGKWGVGLIGVDITDLKKAEDTLRRNEYELRTLVDNSPDIIFRLNRRQQYVYVNPAYERITGIPKDRFLGQTNEQLGMQREMIEFWQGAARQVLESGREGSAEFDMPSLFGQRYFYARLIPEYEKSGLVNTVLVIARDITERRRAEERIRYISFHDEVTGLFNRAFFEEEIHRVDTERDLPVSIIMGDVNNLKLTNDVFGHEEGDALLKAIASCIRQACRQNDIVARWGGDEFAVILPKTDMATAEEIAARICGMARESGRTVLRPSIALGAAAKDAHDQNIYQVIRQAEERMYDDKLARSKENERMVIAALLRQVQERMHDYAAHSDRCRRLGEEFGAALGISEEQLQDLRRLAELHDIGIAAVPPEILGKPRRLTAEEWNVMKKHAEAGFRVVKTYADTAKISDEVYSHNEYWDGSGYPRGLKGKDIPYLARVFLVIDVYDVITHPRPYARTFTPEEAAIELCRGAGRQFDPELVELFLTRVLRREARPATA